MDEFDIDIDLAEDVMLILAIYTKSKNDGLNGSSNPNWWYRQSLKITNQYANQNKNSTKYSYNLLEVGENGTP